jgi:bifunctional DNA-binding transcriptional regulator/antitoxin component of YhaV-PrlF toxin-antitoxin module
VWKRGGFSGLTSVRGDGAIIIPEQVRSRLGLKPHDYLRFQLNGEYIVASKVKDGSKKHYAR